MKNKLSRERIGTGVHFSNLKDNKFKNNRLTVNFILPLSLANASNNAMAILLMRKGPSAYPDFAKFNKRLYSLYGANVYIEITKFNKYQKLGIGISFLDNRYAMEKEDLVTECSALLVDILFDPNLGENGLFKEDALKLEQQYLIDTIQGEINDKRSYAINRMREEMYNDSPIVLSSYGNEETAKKVNPASVTKAWESLIKDSQIEIIFMGSGESDIALEIFKDKFATLERTHNDYKLLKNSTQVEKVKEITENIEGIQQGKLVMGLRVEGLEAQDEIYAAKLFSAAYGGTPFSKLFLNVREKLSLCYYCVSRLDELNNLLVVDSGVETQNVEQATKEILNQLSIFKEGSFTQEELANTKLLMINALSNVDDSLYSLENWYLSQIIKGKEVSPKQEIESLNKITKEMVINAAGKVNLDTIYLLSSKEEAQ